VLTFSKENSLSFTSAGSFENAYVTKVQQKSKSAVMHWVNLVCQNVVQVLKNSLVSFFRDLDGILLDVGNTVFEIRIFSPQIFLLVG